MAYETTEVAVSKSQDAIRKMIYRHKGTGLMLISRPPHEGFEAFIDIEQVPYHVRVMAKCKDVSHDRNRFKRTGGPLERAWDQENRRVWRVLYWHLKAMFEAADSGVIDLRDVVMPYVVMRDGNTLSDMVRPRMGELMKMDSSRILGAGQ